MRKTQPKSVTNTGNYGILSVLQARINRITQPVLSDEDSKRREHILNVLLVGSIVLSGLATLSSTYTYLSQPNYNGIPPLYILVVFMVFLTLLYFSKKGHHAVVSRIFVILYLIPTIFTSYTWGVDLPQGLPTYALLIVAAGILVNSRFGVRLTLMIVTLLLILGYLQVNGLTQPSMNWKAENMLMADAVIFCFTLMVIMLITWLHNREMERSLERAYKSEEALKKERDLLEVRIEERTRELREAQVEKIAQLSRFAEFGRLASGIFHDLVNPLTAVSLHLEQIKDKDVKELKDVQAHLHRALEANKKMEDFIQAIQKQMRQQETKSYFSLLEEVDQIVHILSYKARKANVQITVRANEDIKAYGNPLKFHQIMTNLISNGLDAYEGVAESKRREVMAIINKHKENIHIIVHDWGIGISKENLGKIFDPFFTTKDATRGMGIGLSITKDIIEHDFQGTIRLESGKGEGTVFVIEFPAKSEVEDSANSVKAHHGGA